ncbi:hypothetical protein L249_0510 [Ophiocordyceps polyrhachis-furcata BCC 54312]|uniref:Uncharacterized protein n=1 Tax=Ophiocordyceps polyrhachis-furcata BCC 54312 TaxID=1330021 RepID=A0A367LC98_9HYPO|nr:hypothetical protein L249_0510 [Ophiocordyceps polyrhachis-furcata BCC 54312]
MNVLTRLYEMGRGGIGSARVNHTDVQVIPYLYLRGERGLLRLQFTGSFHAIAVTRQGGKSAHQDDDADLRLGHDDGKKLRIGYPHARKAKAWFKVGQGREEDKGFLGHHAVSDMSMPSWWCEDSTLAMTVLWEKRGEQRSTTTTAESTSFPQGGLGRHRLAEANPVLLVWIDNVMSWTRAATKEEASFILLCLLSCLETWKRAKQSVGIYASGCALWKIGRPSPSYNRMNRHVHEPVDKVVLRVKIHPRDTFSPSSSSVSEPPFQQQQR